MTTKEYDGIPGLPGDLPIAELLAQLRELYCTAINDVLDRCINEVLLTSDEQALLDDAAMFLIFMICGKKVERDREEHTLSNLMRRFRHLMKRMDKEIPGMFAELRRAAEQQPGETEQ